MTDFSTERYEGALPPRLESRVRSFLTAQGLRYLERHNRRLAQGLAIALCVAAVLLFIGFYPLASGIEVPRAWCDAMNWFGQWMWY